MQFIKETHIDFIGKRKIAIAISSALILIGIISLIVRGGPKYGIDFTGGTSLQVQFQKPVNIGEVRKILSNIGAGNAEIKEFGVENEILIRIQQQENMEDISDKVITTIKENMPDNPLDLRMKETVGPRIGSELRRAAIWAILISLALILVYISWRFEFTFAVGAVVALFHDVMITLGIFSLLDLEISLAVVAAFLTIIGYSLNDTIVVFDRIRENLKVLRREKIVDIFNVSINQTLSRTILTSLTTFVVVIILFFFGGEVIHSFSFALVIGVIVGTYSSVFIASPVVVEWKLKRERDKKK
ncbi:protein translocase subunit SecF [candidate division KSB1 bacterium 4484_87]|nr:MAG: protein translocase subunit SecF [candidate division KSB1 bacterium 4484_87]